MWKCAKRSLTATFSRGDLSRRPQQNKELEQLRQNCLLKLTPAVIEHYNQFYNACKNTYENFVKGKKDRERPNQKTWFSSVFHSDFFCALKWGGIFALGYSCVQYKVKIFANVDLRKELYTTIGCQRSLEHLIDSVGIRSYNYVIPEVQAAKTENGRQQFPSQNLKSGEINFNALEKAYQKVLGSLSNSLGTQCMQSGEHKKAVEYFIQSAEEGHAPGMFNLGICHERGLGTDQDFKRAAELYQRAADLGHATAMYNLGVFYAQGKGGIEADLNHARELFKTAANLGQSDAVKALKLEGEATGVPVTEDDLVSNNKEKAGNTLSQLIYERLMNQSLLNFSQHFNDHDDEVKSSCDSLEFLQEKETCLPSQGSDSGVLDMSPENEQYVIFA